MRVSVGGWLDVAVAGGVGLRLGLGVGVSQGDGDGCRHGGSGGERVCEGSGVGQWLAMGVNEQGRVEGEDVLRLEGVVADLHKPLFPRLA